MKKLCATLCAGALLAAMAGTNAPAHADASSCGSHSALEVLGVGVDWWGCQMDVTCPAAHGGPCDVYVDGIASGDGVVGLNVEIDRNIVGTCSFAPMRCEASGSARIPAGDHVTVGCWLDHDAAAFTQVSCNTDIA